MKLRFNLNLAMGLLGLGLSQQAFADLKGAIEACLGSAVVQNECGMLEKIQKTPLQDSDVCISSISCTGSHAEEVFNQLPKTIVSMEQKWSDGSIGQVKFLGTLSPIPSQCNLKTQDSSGQHTLSYWCIFPLDLKTFLQSSL